LDCPDEWEEYKFFYHGKWKEKRWQEFIVGFLYRAKSDEGERQIEE